MLPPRQLQYLLHPPLPIHASQVSSPVEIHTQELLLVQLDLGVIRDRFEGVSPSSAKARSQEPMKNRRAATTTDPTTSALRGRLNARAGVTEAKWQIAHFKGRIAKHLFGLSQCFRRAEGTCIVHIYLAWWADCEDQPTRVHTAHESARPRSSSLHAKKRVAPRTSHLHLSVSRLDLCGRLLWYGNRCGNRATKLLCKYID